MGMDQPGQILQIVFGQVEPFAAFADQPLGVGFKTGREVGGTAAHLDADLRYPAAEFLIAVGVRPQTEVFSPGNGQPDGQQLFGITQLRIKFAASALTRFS